MMNEPSPPSDSDTPTPPAASEAAATSPTPDAPSPDTPPAEGSPPSPASPATGDTTREVKIGTQREGVPAAKPRKPATPIDVPPPEPPKPKAVKLAEIPKSLDDEIAEAMGGDSFDQLMAGQMGTSEDDSSDELEPETRRRATVMRINGDDVFFSLNVRNEGVASLKQFKSPPEIGQMMDVVVARLNAEDGLYEVAIPGAAVSVADWSDINEGSVVDARITGSNTGGLEAMINGIRGFIPASQIALHRVENFGDYVNQKLQCVVTEANPERKNLILSHRALLERAREAEREEKLKQIAVGQKHKGTVISLKDFGAFVDMGGIEGLVHISKMSWDRINHPSEVLEAGQQIEVTIEKIDEESGKIGLSYRDTQANPWDSVDQNYPVGVPAKGVVTRIMEFGAFVKLEPGVEGLIHVSELAHHRVFKVGNVVKQGEEVEVKVTSVDRESQRIGLSLKAMGPAPVKEEKKKPEEEIDDTPRELAVKPTNKPLKGGNNKSSGGEQFGLNW